MRISAFVEVVNRLLPAFNLASRGKGAQSQLSVGKKPAAFSDDGDLYLMICTKSDRNGAKYKLKGNAVQFFTKFVQQGKATIRFTEPAHDICISKADPIQLKGLLGVLKMGHQGTGMDKIRLTPLAPASAKAVERLRTKLVIKSKREYPITTGFPSSLEYLQIVTCNLKMFDSRILALRNLRSLDLSNNCVQKLPADLGKMACLAELVLTDNQIGEIPSGFCDGSLSKTLTLLDLTNNKLQMLPVQLAQLQALVTLKLNKNNLVVLTSGISKLGQLRTLHASGNKLKTLPAGFAGLRMDSLDLYDNEFIEEDQTTAINKLEFCSLVELAARCIKQSRVRYTDDDVGHMQRYLDLAKQCMCGKYCFRSFVHYVFNLDLHRVSSSITSVNVTGTTHAPSEAFLCSDTCFNRYKKNPYATFWSNKS